MSEIPETLVIIPTYNERENIEVLIDRIFAVPRDVHALIIDDSSPDGTADSVRKKQQQYGENRLHLIVRVQGKAGRGSACMEGFSFARDKGYPSAIEMDADLSHDPADIPRFLQKLQEADVVIGSKYISGSRIEGWQWYRKLLSRAANMYAGFVLRMPVHDYTNGYRCYNAKALAALPDLQIDGTGFTVIPQMSYQLWGKGMRLAEIPVVFINRRQGTSNMSIREIAESFLAILRIRSHGLHLHMLQSLKFGITGVLNTILDFGLLTLFVEVFNFNLRLAVVMASGIAITNAFLLHKHWTFGCTDKHYVCQYIQFLMVYGSSFMLNVGITLVLAERMGLWYIFAHAFAIPACAIWNYLWMHFGVFNSSSPVPCSS